MLVIDRHGEAGEQLEPDHAVDRNSLDLLVIDRGGDADLVAQMHRADGDILHLGEADHLMPRPRARFRRGADRCQPDFLHHSRRDQSMPPVSTMKV